jgi:hypothetical protein
VILHLLKKVAGHGLVKNPTVLSVLRVHRGGKDALLTKIRTEILLQLAEENLKPPEDKKNVAHYVNKLVYK